MPSASGYSVLTHEAIVDAAWNISIRPILLQRFPNATPEELKTAHGYAYGGAIIQDLGYYPHGSHFFTDLTHYCRTGDFVLALLRDRGTSMDIHSLTAVNRTREVSAFLAITDVLILGCSNENAMVALGRVSEQLHSSHRNFAETRDRLLRIGRGFREHRAHQNPEITDEHAKTGEYEEFRQLSASNVAFVGRTNRKLFFPQRFATRSSQPIHAVPPTCSPPRLQR